ALDRTAAVGTNVDLDEVRLHLVEVDADARLRETFGKAASTRVVVDDAVDVVVERIQRCRCDDPRLAHRAPEVVLAATRLRHQFHGARDQRAERTAEPFRETEGHGVEAAPDPGRIDTGRDSGIDEPRAVEVSREVMLAAGCDDRVDLVERPGTTSGAVVG